MQWKLIFSLLIIVACVPAMAGRIEVPSRSEQARVLGERSPQLRVVSSAAPWIRKTEHAGIVYLLYVFPSRVERFSLATGSMLPSIPLSAPPRGMAVSADGIFVSQNTRVSRFSLDGTNEQVLPTVWPNADDLAISGGYLLSTRQGEIQSVRIADMNQVAVYQSIGSYYTPRRMSVARDAGIIFGWQTGLSPSDILRIPVLPDGTFGSVIETPYHGAYPAGTTVFPDASGAFVLDDAGIAFRGSDLTYRSGTGGPINDAVLHAGFRYVLREDSIARLDSDFREQGMVRLTNEAHAIGVHGDNVFVFRDTGSGPTAQIVPIAAFAELPVGPAPDPRTTPYVVDHADLADDGTLYLFSRAQRVVHRFSIPQWSFLPSVALPLEPTLAAVDRAGSRVYIAYSGGRLGVIPAGATQEQFLAFGPIGANGMGAADDLVMTCDFTGAWESHRIYDSAGTQTDWEEWNYCSRDFSWSRATRRMFFFRDLYSPNDLHFEEISTSGQITAEGESPYHGEVLAIPPIRPSPNGSIVYLGSGQILDGINLNLIGTLPLQPTDVAWMGSTLYSLHPAQPAGRARLVRWNGNNTISNEGALIGTPVRTFTYGAQVITVTGRGGSTQILRWPGSLSGIDLSATLSSVSPPALPGAQVGFTAEVTNKGLSAATSATLTVSLSAPIDQLTWLCDGPAGSIPCGTSTGLQIASPLAPGETLRATAFGAMPAGNPQNIGIVATAGGVAGVLDPTDDVATATIAVADTLFASGFE